MAKRSVYLAKCRTTASQRAHFAIFIPNVICDRHDLATSFKTAPCHGGVIHVVGEPLMSGYAHEFKRNYDCVTMHDIQELVFLSYVNEANIFEPTNSTFGREGTPRARLEREALLVNPPPRGQNLRAPIDGILARRCQEWTIDYIKRLVAQSLICEDALDIAQSHRDPPTHGIFGFKSTEARSPGSAQARNQEAGVLQALHRTTEEHVEAGKDI